MYYFGENYNDELYHYGVPGMKWGQRKYYNENGSLNKAGKARQSYKDSKKELRTANKELRTANKALRRASWTAAGIKGIAKYKKAEAAAKKAQTKATNSYVNTVQKKAALKAATSKNAEKAEFKVYKNAMRKTGLRDSYNDITSGGRSTAVYNAAKVAKGKAYADKIEKRVQKEVVAGLVGSVVVTTGTAFVSAYLNSRQLII